MLAHCSHLIVYTEFYSVLHRFDPLVSIATIHAIFVSDNSFSHDNCNSQVEHFPSRNINPSISTNHFIFQTIPSSLVEVHVRAGGHPSCWRTCPTSRHHGHTRNIVPWVWWMIQRRERQSGQYIFLKLIKIGFDTDEGVDEFIWAFKSHEK